MVDVLPYLKILKLTEKYCYYIINIEATLVLLYSDNKK